MIKFDPSSIFNRSLSKLQQDPNWRVIANNSVISALLKSNAEINAETARYAEYLFKESKWDTAQNESSILAMSNLLGYQPKRKISATGEIIISADPRMHLVGKTLPLSAPNNSIYSWNTLKSDVYINSNSIVMDSKGNSYIPLSKMFNANTKTMSLSIIQGKRKSAFIDIDTIRNTSTQSKLDPYLYIPLKISNCEDASSLSSKGFFRVYVVKTQGTEVYTEEYRVVDTMLLSNSGDYDVEVYNDMYSRELFYLKFNNDTSRGRTLDISRNTSIAGIRVDYIETLGEEGNLLNLYENFTVADVVTEAGNLTGIKLYGINKTIISGGKSEETIVDVKREAPKYYITNYTTGTKEAYEQAVLNMKLKLENVTLVPSKVQVFGSTSTDDNGNLLPVTCISFIAPGLEDLIQDNEAADNYADIEEALNYYLTRLKSPQDTLKFSPPNYVDFSIGIKCKVDKEKVDDIVSLESEIRELVDSRWGTNSTEVDFSKNFYPSSIISEINNNFPEVVSINTEIEAIKKLNMNLAMRKAPQAAESSSSTIIHTFRIPFDFSQIFMGNQSIKGFKDHRSGSDYVMRIDFMYKKPKNMSGFQNYHTTLFIQEDKNLSDRSSNSTSFYIKKSTSQENIWASENNWQLAPVIDYGVLKDTPALHTSRQYYYRQEVYNDNDYKSLIDDSQANFIPTINSYLVDPGAIDDYLIYFSGSYDEDSSYIGDGWIELTFDPIYKMLSTFALYDPSLKEKLQRCPLANLKCNNAAVSEDFEVFREVLSDYIDIYVAMRPIDQDLVISTKDATLGSSLLVIDSFDIVSENNTTDLTDIKKKRMISVQCEFED